MGEPIAYDVVLTPRGSELDTTDERREMTVSVPPRTTDREDIHEAAVSRASETRGLDAWAVRNHWEVGLFLRTDGTAKQRLQDALLSCSLSDAAWGTLEPRRIDVYDDRSDEWRSTLLALEPPVCEDLRHWVGEVRRNAGGICWSTGAELDAAMIEVVAEENPDVVNLFATDPLLAYYTFAQTCLSNAERVAAKLK